MIWWALTGSLRVFPPSSKLRPRREASTLPRIVQILVIDDDRATRDLFRQVLGDEGHELLLVSRLEESSADAEPDLVITDLVGLDRYDTARAHAAVRRIEERYPATPIVVCTGFEEAAEEPEKLGVAAVLRKPFTIEELVQVVARLAAS